MYLGVAGACAEQKANAEVETFSLSLVTDIASVDTGETYATELLLSPTQVLLALDGTGTERTEAYDYTVGDASLPSNPWSSTDTLNASLTNPRALCWGNNGQYLYQGHQLSGAQVVRRTLTTNYDIGAATFSRSSTSNPTGIQGMHFKPDGLTFFLLGANNRIYTCTTSTAWDVSSYTADSGTLITSDVDGDGDSISGGTGIRFNTDGTRMFISYRINTSDPDTTSAGRSKIVQYNLSTAWDISTRGQPVATKNLHPDLGYEVAPPSAQAALVAGFDWTSDGSELLVASVHPDATTNEFRVLRYKAP